MNNTNTSQKLVLINPYTGKVRHPLDVESDPEGLLIVAPSSEVKAYKDKA